MTKTEFYTKWMQAFAPDISKADYVKYVVSTGGYIWHVFSFGLLNAESYLEGDAAKKAYDAVKKHDALYADDDGVNDLPWDRYYSASSLDEFVEVYVVSNDFKWTYIKTHEDSCGPYFMRL